MNQPLKFSARHEDYTGRIAVYMWRRDEHGTVAVPDRLTFRHLKEDELPRPQEPLMVIDPEEAQRLMDALWDAGLRPSEGSGSAGQLAAVQRHLEDMRTLVFKK